MDAAIAHRGHAHHCTADCKCLLRRNSDAAEQAVLSDGMYSDGQVVHSERSDCGEHKLNENEDLFCRSSKSLGVGQQK